MATFTTSALALFIAAHNCVKPEVAPVIIGIASAESGLSEYAIHDNTGGISFTPSSVDEAVKLAKALMAHDHDLDLGIGQVNVRNLGWTGLTVETAFDACRNLAAASRILFVRYNGNPPDAQKIAYAQRVTARIGAADTVAATRNAELNAQRPSIFLSPHPAHELVFSSP